MKIHIFGQDSKKIEELKDQLKEFDIDSSEERPDLVICYGGDGTFLISERVFPGVPKIFLKGSEISAKGHDIDIKKALEIYLKGNYKIQEIKKLRASYKGIFETRELIGVNDIVIRNTLPTEALRFKVKINNEFLCEGKEFIGDGVVIATSYGSGGYFKSITKKDFEKGIGLGFNNVRGNPENKFLNEDTKIGLEIVRGPGVLVSDNNRDYIPLEKGDKIFIEQIDEVARRVLLNGEN